MLLLHIFLRIKDKIYLLCIYIVNICENDCTTFDRGDTWSRRQVIARFFDRRYFYRQNFPRVYSKVNPKGLEVIGNAPEVTRDEPKMTGIWPESDRKRTVGSFYRAAKKRRILCALISMEPVFKSLTAHYCVPFLCGSVCYVAAKRLIMN